MPNTYDNIFRENNEAFFLNLIKRHFGFDIVETSDLPGKMVRTLEREPDFVKMVKTSKGEKFIIHLEYQTTNDPNMMDRMRLYHAMLMEKYKVRVRQLVVYIGQEPARMKTQMSEEEVMSGFELLDLARSDVEVYLNSEVVEEVIMAILTGFERKNAKAVVRLILQKVIKAGKDKNHIDRALQQLILFSRISNLESLVKKEIQNMPLTIDITQYELYQEGKVEGIAEGRAEGMEKAVEQMLRLKSNTVSEIVKISGFSMEKIMAIRDRIEGE